MRQRDPKRPPTEERPLNDPQALLEAQLAKVVEASGPPNAKQKRHRRKAVRLAFPEAAETGLASAFVARTLSVGTHEDTIRLLDAALVHKITKKISPSQNGCGPVSRTLA
jgi:hypothetical protein